MPSFLELRRGSSRSRWEERRLADIDHVDGMARVLVHIGRMCSEMTRLVAAIIAIAVSATLIGGRGENHW